MKGILLERTDSGASASPFTSSASPINDAIIVSDLHLGSSLCQDRIVIEFLERLVSSEIHTRQLILNGDVFDSIDFRRLNKRHWKILSLIRKLSDRILITWVCGNHDGPSSSISHLLGVQVSEEYIFTSNGQSVLVLHGHQFDDFINMYPTITFLADVVYRLLQWIDRTHRFARFAKSNTKIFLRCIEKIRTESIAYAKSKNIGIVCCGHTHHAESSTEDAVSYFNSGCWTESPPTYLSVQNGNVHLRTYFPSPPQKPDEVPEISESGAIFTSRKIVLN